MVPDIDARQRLHVEVVEKDGKKTNVINSDGIADRWDQSAASSSSSSISRRMCRTRRRRPPRRSWRKTPRRPTTSFASNSTEYLTANADDIAAYFGSLDRFENDPERHQHAPFQKQRRWDRMMELRGEADRWIKDIEGQEQAYAQSLYSCWTTEQKQRGLVDAELESLAMGSDEADRLCGDVRADGHRAMLDARAFTPLAALGGACFMCFVVLTQPAFPTHLSARPADARPFAVD